MLARVEVLARTEGAAGRRRHDAMQRIAALDQRTCAGLRAVLLDIDDTLTTEGRLTPDAYAALAALGEAGLAVVPVTGRPAGWCDMIARFWPCDGVVGENGALAYRYDRAGRRMHRIHATPEPERHADRQRLDALAARILAEVPGAALSADQPFRIADLAIDFCEDVTPLPRDAVLRIVAMFEAAGATAKVSSIHVNGWFGRYDKLGMSQRFLETALGITPTQARAQVAFIGDSPNDEPMFRAFPISVGVANVMDHADLIVDKPAYVTSRRSGDGFVEFVQHLLARRAGSK